MSLDKFYILIVDDNANNLFTLRALLNEHIPDAEVVDADSGQSALKKVLETPVDLIILDVQMPDMDGFETARLLQAWKKTRHIPVVFLTAAYKSEEFRQKGLELGATDYLTKPIDTSQLVSKVKTYLRFIGKERTHRHELQQANENLSAEMHERQQAEQALDQLTRQYQLILNSTAEGLCGMNLQGNITFINPAALAMLGYHDAKEVVGQNQHNLLHHSKIDGEAYAVKDCPICSSLQDAQVRRVDHEVFWRKDGDFFPVEYIVAPLIGELGKPVGAIVSFQDVTERKQAEYAMREAKIAAEQANMAKTQFLANMSHELRTPLNAIIGYSEIILEELRAEAEDAQQQVEDNFYFTDVSKIYKAGNHLLSLISSVLDIARIEAGQLQLHPSAYEIEHLVQEVLATIKPTVVETHNQLITEIAESLGVIYTDVTKFRQLLLNLLDNACKFTENGKIYLRIVRIQCASQNSLLIEVQDTGIGMNPETLDKLFQPFTQADGSYTRKYGGAGVGLTLTKNYLELMGGTLQVTSLPAQGSTFSVTLPILDPPTT